MAIIGPRPVWCFKTFFFFLNNVELWKTSRSPLLTPQDTRKMYGVVKSDKKRPLREVTNIFNDEYRALDVYLIELFKENCMKQKCCKYRLRFRDYNVKKRLAWCKVNRHKTVNDFWKKVIYSDECKVELGMVTTRRRMDSTMLESRS